MLTRRVVVCLDVRRGRVVKGVGFDDLRDVGDPTTMAQRYETDGADEVVFLDIAASVEERATMLDVARRTAERLFIPLTLGGGIRDADDVARALRAGADKVSINTAAALRPALLSECADRFGSQCVVAAIDARREDPGTWEVYVRAGREATGRDVVEWASCAAELGAGEILLTSIDRDGRRTGYDLELTQAVAAAVRVPVIASGGAGNARHVQEVLTRTAAEAALVAGIVHDGTTTIPAIKTDLARAGVPIRMRA